MSASKSIHKRSHSQTELIQKRMSIEEMKRLDETCYTPENYFDLKLNPLMGRGNKGPRFNENKKPVKYTIVCGDRYEDWENMNRKTQMNIRLKEKESSAVITGPTFSTGSQINTEEVSPTTTFNKKKMASKMDSTTYLKFGQKNSTNYQIVNSVQLETYFNILRKQMDKNHFETNHFIKDCPSIIQENILKQEQRINEMEIKKLKQEKMAKYLQKMTRRSKSTLLFNSDSIAQKRVINEFNELIEQNTHPFKLSLQNYWVTSLRKSDSSNEVRDSVINIGTENHPMWRSFKEYGCDNNPKPGIVRMPHIFSPYDNNETFQKTMSHFKFTSPSEEENKRTTTALGETTSNTFKNLAQSQTNMQVKKLYNNNNYALNKKMYNTKATCPFSFNNLKSVADIFVEGKNLLNEEEKHSKQLKGPLKLYHKTEKYEPEEVLEVIDVNYGIKDLNKLGNNRLY